MKAYYVGIPTHPDAGNEIIFANNYKEAVNKARNSDLFNDHSESFIDVSVSRDASWDDFYSKTDEEILIEKWRRSWWFHKPNCPDPDLATEEEFLKWYKS